MKAAVLHGKEDVRVEEVAERALQPGEVRIHIEAALTCGTDLKVFKRGYHARMIVPPAVFGHELAGTISEAAAPPSVCSDLRQVLECGSPLPLSGSQVPTDPKRQRAAAFQNAGATKAAPVTSSGEWRIGDRVVVANSAPCGNCFHCKVGQENLCEDLMFLNGAYAESIVVPARLVQKNLLRLKPETEFRDAALVEPLACVVQGVEDTQLSTGQHVLVIGAGPIGLMFVALAKHLGCDVTVAGRREARLKAAARLEADQVIDIGDGHNLPAKIREATKTHFDAIIEATGKPEVWEASVHLVRKGGAVNFFGGCPAGTTITLDTTLIHYSNLTLLASFHHTPRTIRRALEFIEAGVIHSRDFVDGECPLTKLPELLRDMANGNRAVKTLIRVRE